METISQLQTQFWVIWRLWSHLCRFISPNWYLRNETSGSKRDSKSESKSRVWFDFEFLEQIWNLSVTKRPLLTGSVT